MTHLAESCSGFPALVGVNVRSCLLAIKLERDSGSASESDTQIPGRKPPSRRLNVIKIKFVCSCFYCLCCSAFCSDIAALCWICIYTQHFSVT